MRRMVMFCHRLPRWTVVVAAMHCALAASACTVPVFRYALERWEADPYEVIVFHRDPLSMEQQAILETTEQTSRDGLANLVLRKVDLAGEIPQRWRALWSAQKDAVPPWMVVNYPQRMRIEQPVWAGPLAAEAVGALLESPARRDIARRLLSGETTIWLLIESGDKRRDDDVAGLIEVESRKLERSLDLPELSPLDPINANLPLKIAFSTLRLGRSNTAERLFINMLLNWNEELTSVTKPILFPIFGRGRVLPPAIGEEIQPEAIRSVAEFLTGACSCEIKEMNPGYDLLLGADWNSLLSYGEVRSPELPLVGLSQFAAPATNHETTATNQPAVSLAAASPPSAVIEHSSLVRNLVILLALGVVFLAAATLALRARANRKPR